MEGELEEEEGRKGEREGEEARFVVLSGEHDEEDKKHLSNPPYSMAINTLRHLEDFKTPTRKLRCLSEAVNQICRCALAYRRTWRGGK
jgi:hypothetical protein